MPRLPGRGKKKTKTKEQKDQEQLQSVTGMFRQMDDKFVVMGTRRGVVKKTALSGFSNPRAGGIIAMGVEEGDAVIAVELSDGHEQIFLGTRDGIGVHRPKRRADAASAARCR